MNYRPDNLLLLSARIADDDTRRQAERNKERLDDWRFKYTCQLRRYPNGDIQAHKISAARYVQELLSRNRLDEPRPRFRFGRALLRVLRA